MPEAAGDSNQTLERVLHLVTRRRWWIIVPAVFVALGTVGVVLVLPDRYSSEASLVVVQQQIPQAVVTPLTTTAVADEVDAMTREILSRNRLLGVINEFNLYGEEKKKSTPQALAARMRKDVEIEPIDMKSGGNFTAFKITFSAKSAQLAQQVTSRLTSLFIEENLKTRGDQVTRTADFLSEQIEAAKQRLTEQEQLLADFKKNNLGELPEQQTSNFGALTDLRIQLANVSASQRRAQDQRTSIESLIAGNVARLESERATLLNRLTPRHPEVLKRDPAIARMKRLLERVRTGGSPESDASDLSAEDSSVIQLKNQVDANTHELENLSRDEERLKTEIARYQQHVNVAPLREQELTSILRNYELFKQNYADLVSKQLRSQQSADLEERQEGQRFRLVDPPTLPAAPSSPKRFLIGLGGVAGGIAIGLALAFLVNLKDQSYYSDKQVKQHFPIPLIVAVPVLHTVTEERRRNRKRAFEWVAAVAMTLVVCAAELYVFRHG
jgi:succinoglycan biosynthesis transport protein ExoP